MGMKKKLQKKVRYNMHKKSVSSVSYYMSHSEHSHFKKKKYFYQFLMQK